MTTSRRPDPSIPVFLIGMAIGLLGGFLLTYVVVDAAADLVDTATVEAP